ncbi:MAG: ABC transporter permease subunit [Clostridiales bacterium]|nr:ABC transporter permease subunit [Clostridiales bacterium]
MIIDMDVIFASPLDTIMTIGRFLTEASFYKTIGCTFLRIAAGFFLGTAAGVILGGLTGFFKPLCALFKSIIDIVRAAPVASFIILALIWFKTGRVPVFIAFLTVVPIIWSNVTEGIASVDVKILEMAEVYNFTPSQKLKKIYVPAVMPYFRSAAVTGAGFAFKSGVAAEVIGSPAFSIGRELYEAKVYLETAELFAWTAVIIILSVVFEKLLVRFMGRQNGGTEKYHEKL